MKRRFGHLDKKEIRDIAREESVKVFSHIRDSLEWLTSRPNGNINAGDFYKSLELAEERYKKGFSNDKNNEPTS